MCGFNSGAVCVRSLKAERSASPPCSGGLFLSLASVLSLTQRAWLLRVLQAVSRPQLVDKTDARNEIWKYFAYVTDRHGHIKARL